MNKQKIQIDNNKTGQILFLSTDSSINSVKKQVSNSIENLNKIYKINIPKIIIELIYSREELNNKLKRETPNWLVGNTFQNKICLFSPLAIEKYSIHKKSELRALINHELCHIFNRSLDKKMPLWLDEGLALYFSNQKKNKSFKKSDWDFFTNRLDKNMSFDSFVKHDGYKISYYMILKTLEKTSINKLIDTIKTNNYTKLLSEI